MNAQMKYWAWMVVWSCSCLLAIMMQGSNFAFANDEVVKNDVMNYWEMRLHGMRLPTSLCAMVSPLSSHEATQLLVTISASGGHYLPTHAATFCKATHIKCAQAEKEPNEFTKKVPFFYGANRNEIGKKTKEHTRKVSFFYDATYHTQEVPFFYDNAHLTKVMQKLPSYYYGANGHTQEETKEHIEKLPSYYYGANDYTQEKIKETIQKLPSYHYGANDHTQEETKEYIQKLPSFFYETKERIQKLPIYYYGSNDHTQEKIETIQKLPSYYYGANNHTQEETKEHIHQKFPNFSYKTKERIQKLPSYYYGANNHTREETKEHIQKLPNFFYETKERIQKLHSYFYSAHQTKFEKESKEGNRKLKQETSQKKPTLKTYEMEDSKTLRPLTSNDVHEIFGSYFREKQVLVSGVEIRVNFGDYNGDAEEAKADRAFLPRKLAKLFSLRGDGAKIASMLGVAHEDLQETLFLCNSGHNTNEQVSMCLTSLEDVADFVASILGASLDAYDAISNAGLAELEKAGYTFRVLHVKELTTDLDEPFVTCHDMAFPFRVFYCHYAKQTKVFQVTLQAKDKSRHQRVVVCHYDTSYWIPQHKAFVELETKPGESEVCHWLGGMWLRHTGWVFVHGATASAHAVI